MHGFPKSEMLAMIMYYSLFYWIYSHLDTWSQIAGYHFVISAVWGVTMWEVIGSHMSGECQWEWPYLKDEDNWWSYAIRTTCALKGNRLVDFCSGGFNFHVEHHFWPRMPFYNLRAAAEIVVPVLKKHNMMYDTPSWSEGMVRVYRHL